VWAYTPAEKPRTTSSAAVNQKHRRLPSPTAGRLDHLKIGDGCVGEAAEPAVSVSRQGKASVVEVRNPRFLNALDDRTIAPLETAVDLAIMDPATEIAVLRGGVIQGKKPLARRG